MEQKENELRELLRKDYLTKTEAVRAKDLAFDLGFACAFDYLKREFNNAKDIDSFYRILFH